MKCKFCGKELSGNEEFCADCGNKVSNNKDVKAFIIVVSISFLSFVMFYMGFNSLYNILINYTPSIISEEDFIKESENIGCKVINVLETTSYDNVLSYYVTDKNSCSYLMSYTRFDDINVMSNYYASLNSEIKQFDGQNFYAYHSNKLSYNHIALSKYNEYVLYVGDIYKDSVANINDKIVLYFEVGKSDKNVVKKFKENIDANFKINWSFVIYFSLGLGIIFILIFVGFWKLFVKMGFPGWKSLIPIYNIACLSEATIGKKKYAWLLLIPYVNIIFILILFYNIAKVFGKGFGSQLFTVLLPSFMIPLIAFDESKYVKPVDINKEKESSSVKKVEDTEIKKQSLLSKIICWIITIFMLFISFFEFLIAFEDKEFIIYTLFTLIFAIMACPPISAYTRKFKKYTKYKKAIVIILVILLFILFATL